MKMMSGFVEGTSIDVGLLCSTLEGWYVEGNFFLHEAFEPVL